MTIPEYIAMRMQQGIRKSAAAEEVQKITGCSARYVWKTLSGDTQTSVVFCRLLAIYCDKSLPENLKKKHFPEI